LTNSNEKLNVSIIEFFEIKLSPILIKKAGLETAIRLHAHENFTVLGIIDTALPNLDILFIYLFVVYFSGIKHQVLLRFQQN
jgi:hypothetical protein